MTHAEQCIQIFNRAAQRNTALGRLMNGLFAYVYAAALPEGQRIYHGMPTNFGELEQGQHLRADYNHASTRKAILNGHTADFEQTLAATGIAPETHAAAVGQIRGAMNEYLRAHVHDGCVFDNDGDFRRNVANAAIVRVADVFGLN